MHLQLSFTSLHHHYLCMHTETQNQKDKTILDNTWTVKQPTVNLRAVLDVDYLNSTFGVLR